MAELKNKRKWLIAGGVLAGLVVLAGAAVLNLNSLIARNKDYLIGQAEQALGRKIKVGAIEATLFSGLGVKLGDFSMSDDRQFSNDDFIRAKDLQVNVRFWPLLKKDVQVKRLILHDPAIVVIRNAAGEFNFATIGKKDPESKEAKEAAAKEKAEKEKKERGEKEKTPATYLVSLVDISGGEVRYLDKKSGADVKLQQIDLRVEDFDLTKPFTAQLAAAVYADKQNLKLTSKLGPLPANGDFGQLPMTGKLDVDPLDMTKLKAAAPKLQEALSKDLDLAGVFRLKDLKFSGTPKDLTLSAQFDGSNGAVRYGSSFHKPAGMALMLDADAHYRPDRIEIKKAQLKMHTLDLATQGTVQLGESTVLDLSLDSKPASLDGWDKIVPALAKYQLSGTMELQARVRGKAGKGSAPEIQGSLSLVKASIKPPQFPKPLENLDTKINFTGQRADIRDMTLSLGSSRIRLAAAVEKFSPLTFTYKLTTPEIFPADYNAGLSEERKGDVLRNLRSDGRFGMAGGTIAYQGTVNSADGRLYNIPYKALDATISLANQVTQIRNLKINALSGVVQMDGEYSLKEAVPQFTMSTKVQGIDIKELYTALDAKAERDLRGKLNADMKLAGAGKSWEEIKPALKGQGSAEVLQGALLNFNIADGALGGITGIPGLTNIISPSLRRKYPETFTAKDTEFKEMTMLLDVADGRINVKNLRLAAAEFLVQGAGYAEFSRKVDFRTTINFSERLSADLTQAAKETKYLLNNQGQLEVPLALTGRLPNVKAVPDSRYLAQIAQRGFMRKGIDELQNRLGGKPAPAQEDKGATDNKKKKRPTDDLIRKGLEGLFKR
ncbi:MAG: AsmA family protein [Deltaproteobacteria bacterium]|nr:AsmA family protein [Deltaproteobacteria bacterium]